MGIIYEASNTLNNVLYIGKTIRQLKIRATQHCDAAKAHRDNFYFHSALRKYGCSAFEWRVLIEVDDSELSAWERYYIDLALDQGFDLYNLTEGGEGITGFKHSEESKQRIRESNKGLQRSEESKERMRVSNKGKSTEQAIRSMQEANAKVYRLRSPEGQIIEIHNMSKFCKQYGLNAGHMVDVANGKRKSSHGWTRVE